MINKQAKKQKQKKQPTKQKYKKKNKSRPTQRNANSKPCFTRVKGADRTVQIKPSSKEEMVGNLQQMAIGVDRNLRGTNKLVTCTGGHYRLTD